MQESGKVVFEERTDHLRDLLKDARDRGLFLGLTALIIDATDTKHRDVFKLFQKHALHLGAVSVASLLESAGFKRVKAIYEVLTPRIDYSKAHPDFVGISAIIPNLPFANKKIRHMRMLNPDALIVAGGSGYFFDADSALRCGADAVVIGKAEYALVNFLKHLASEKRDGESLRDAMERLNPDFAGVYTGKNEIRTAPLPEMDEIPHINYKLIHGKQSRRMRTILSSYGCTVRDCDFCSAHRLNSGKYKCNSTFEFVDKLWQSQRDGVHEVFVGDDHMFGRGWKKMNDLFHTLIEERRHNGLKVGIGAQITIDSIYQHLDDGIVDLMYDAGFRVLYFGVESTDDEDLKQMNASGKMSREKATAVFRALDGRINSHAMCVLKPFVEEDARKHVPYSEIDTPDNVRAYRGRIMKMVDYLREHGVRTAQFHSAVPAPGAGMTEGYFKAGIVLSSVGKRKISPAHYTGQYVVASSNPAASYRIMIDAYRRFYSPSGIAGMALKRRFSSAILRGIGRFIVESHCASREARRYWNALKNDDFNFCGPDENHFAKVYSAPAKSF